jgi:large conductance mechanosensitive channel
MGRLRELLAHGGIAVLAVLFALSFATFNLAVAVSRELVSALQQRAFDEDGEGDLSFTIFGTNISYAEVLLYAIAFVIVAAGLLGTWLLTRRDMRTCPECRSHVPREATTCRFCTSELQSEPVDA